MLMLHVLPQCKCTLPVFFPDLRNRRQGSGSANAFCSQGEVKHVPCSVSDIHLMVCQQSESPTGASILSLLPATPET